MAAIDLGIATGVLATFLGTDPINVGGTPEQKADWMGRARRARALLMAYGATEPQAGSDLAALTTTAVPVEEDGKVVGYRITGRKQWISNGGVADLYTILANAPGGPIVVRRRQGAPGLHARQARGQARHPRSATRRRSSSRTSYVPADRLSAASRARASRRRRPSSATRA